jgi:hypothetical protein
MENLNFNEDELKLLLEKLKERGYTNKAVSLKIGFDENGQMMTNALNGRSKRNIELAIIGIRREFYSILELPALENNIEQVTMRTINDKLNRILELLEKK